MNMITKVQQNQINKVFRIWSNDWNKFVKDGLGARLDKEQQDIISSVQHNKMTAVASGTARGKDFVAACAALCFMYLTPRFDKDGNLIENTKIAMTAPTGRQVSNIMTPEVRRLLRNGRSRFPFLFPGRLVADDIRTNYEEWFLTGFKADDNATEAWSGFHAVNTMFIVTEASGVSQKVFNAIEGNLQGNSRLVLVFNPNVSTGYAAKAMKSKRFNRFRLSSLNAENVVTKKNTIPGQVDYDWVNDKVETWCNQIFNDEFCEKEGDFKWEGKLYRPNDLFRVKVLGLFPKVEEDVIIPYEWIQIANERWKMMQELGYKPNCPARIGVDVAGMGRDSSILVPRYEDYVSEFLSHNSAGKADHMHVAGMISFELDKDKKSKAFIDTIGEGAGVYSRLQELDYDNAFSCKFSEGAKFLSDTTGEYTFANMRAYCYWAMRDWFNPRNGHDPAIPEDDDFMEEATATHWKFQSNGTILIEAKEDIKKRIKRSPDKSDALANTFYPYDDIGLSDEEILRDFK